MSRLDAVLADLRAEGDQLEDLVVTLDDAGWRMPTPARGWDVAHQVAHLAWTDEMALAAATDRAGLGRRASGTRSTTRTASSTPRPRSAPQRPPTHCSPDGVRRAPPSPRRCTSCPQGARLPWYGPPMSATSMATARFMETWAHARDVAAALGIELPAHDRVRHVVHLGVRTRDFAFGNRGLSAPDEEFHLALTLPSGEVVEHGPADAAQRRDRLGLRLRPAGHPAGAPRRHRPGRGRRGRERLAGPRAGLRRTERRRADPAVSEVLRVGNGSGFYGDRLSAMREMLDGGELDVLTGDYLAELTMLILGRDRLRDPALGYARTFVRQVEECLGLALERGVRIVANAGGLNPAGLAARLREVAAGSASTAHVAHVEGDDVARTSASTAPSPPTPTSAGSASPPPAPPAPTSSSPAGSPTPRWWSVPAVAHFGWTRTTYDELAGAVVAGHVIECGAQATGGNFSGFTDRPATARVPARRALRRRVVRGHQARRHRRVGHGGHRHRAAGLRDPVRALPRPRRHRAPRHGRADPGRAGPRPDRRRARRPRRRRR